MKWWSSVAGMELRKILAYRSDFWITFLGQTFIQLFIARALWQNIFDYQKTDSMQGYSLSMLSLYYLLVPIGTRMLSGENIGFISREIYDGSFNRYLIYPLSVFHYKAITYLTHSTFYALQLILAYFLYHLFFSDVSANSFSLFCGLGIFFMASITYLAMAMLIELIALWADNIWSLMLMLRFFTSFLGGGFIPLVFFPSWAISILYWTPFPYLVALPVKTIMGLSTSEEIFHGITMLVIWLLLIMSLIRFVWRRGEKIYSGVGI